MYRDVLLYDYNEITKNLKELSKGEIILLIKDIEFFTNNLRLELKNREDKNG